MRLNLKTWLIIGGSAVLLSVSILYLLDDIDNDGLKNYYELPLGTKLNNSDTDPKDNQSTPKQVLPASNTGGITGGLKIPPPTNGVYLGAYDWSGNGISVFEQAVGVKIAIAGAVTYIKDGGTEGTPLKFDTAGHEKAYQQGYVTTFGIEYLMPSSTHSPQAIIDGSMDSEIKQAAQDIKAWGRPIFWLYQREPLIQPIGYDGGGYGPNGDKKVNDVSDKYGQYGCTDSNDEMCMDGPERYRDAAKHIHDLVESVAPNHVTWVMGANTGWKAGQYKMFYPGDNYVDWHAFDRYPLAPGESQGINYISFANHVLWKEALGLSDKPIMILELGIHMTDKNNNLINRDVWFTGFFADVKTNPKMKNLKAIMYWQMGAQAFDGSSTRIESNDPVSQIWQQEIIANPNFWISNVAGVTGSGGGSGTNVGGEAGGRSNSSCYNDCMAEVGNTVAICNNWCASVEEKD